MSTIASFNLSVIFFKCEGLHFSNVKCVFYRLQLMVYRQKIGGLFTRYCEHLLCGILVFQVYYPLYVMVNMHEPYKNPGQCDHHGKRKQGILPVEIAFHWSNQFCANNTANVRDRHIQCKLGGGNFFPATLHSGSKDTNGCKNIQHLVNNHKTADKPGVDPVHF